MRASFLVSPVLYWVFVSKLYLATFSKDAIYNHDSPISMPLSYLHLHEALACLVFRILSSTYFYTVYISMTSSTAG